jgi:hypothetical protein
VMTHKEAVDKIAFACEVPIKPAATDLFFTPADFDAPPAVVDLPPIETTQVDFPDMIPPEVAELLPPMPVIPNMPNGPGVYVPTYTPPPFGGPNPEGPVTLGAPPAPPPPLIGPTPEPASFVLVAFGIGAAGLFSRRRAEAYRA